MTEPASQALPPKPAQELLDEIRSSFSHGEFFRSYDLAVEAATTYPGDWRFAHDAILSLANAGATELAVTKFKELHLECYSQTEMRALGARLKKDLGFAETGAARQGLLCEARGEYEAAFRDAVAAQGREAYYPGINAATLALLTGDKEAAVSLAREVLALLDRRLAPGAQASDRYWILATALEANIVAGDLAAARALVPQVLAAGERSYASLATTGRQLERIAEAQGLTAELLSAFRTPAIVHYVGHIISPGAGRFPASQEAAVASEIERVVGSMAIGAAYGSLAAGSDILFAEAMLRRNIALNVILPFKIDEFLVESVRTAGASWEGRFRACLDKAKTVRFATEDAYLGDDHLFTYCSRLAMGLAVLLARHMHAPLRQLVVWDGDARSGTAGTVADMTTWQRAGHPQTTIRCGDRAEADDLSTYKRPTVPRGRRDTRAMLFGDIHHFSKLTDAQLPVFAEHVMGTLGEVLRRYREDVSFVNTWGDGIFVVFSDAGRAADCALAMQAALAKLDLGAVGLPDTLKLRLGGHLGPIYELPDPIMGRPNYYGAHVSRCARIEPITPESCVYVTETFAAVLALYNAGEFTCDYVGHTEMAKHYGSLRMFLLKRASNARGPAVLANIDAPAQV